MEIYASNIHTLGTSMLCTEQKWNITCKTPALQLCHCNKGNFKSIVMSASGILQKQKYIHDLKHGAIIAPHSLEATILHAFYDSKGHQETIHTF